MPRPVHPHACGEHMFSLLICLGTAGSSPRMWGTHEKNWKKANPARFIPTHVGNTAEGGIFFMTFSVHPHACGEHRSTSHSGGSTGGSSPRMWGTPMASMGTPHVCRFIPTHVGNTYPSFRAYTLFTVHPHACGEHLRMRESLPVRGGSSPRMWGTLHKP